MSSSLPNAGQVKLTREISVCIDSMVQSDETSQNPEYELMARLHSGDNCAMTELVCRYGPGLNRLIGRMTGWSSESDDILQEVFLTAWKKAGQYRGNGSLEGWLRKLAVNRCRNHHRARKVFDQLLTRFTRLRRRELAASHDRAQDLDLQVAMSKLNDDDRIVLVLFYLEELDGAAISELIGVRADAVHMRLHRARTRLRNLLETEGPKSDESH